MGFRERRRISSLGSYQPLHGGEDRRGIARVRQSQVGVDGVITEQPTDEHEAVALNHAVDGPGGSTATAQCAWFDQKRRPAAHCENEPFRMHTGGYPRSKPETVHGDALERLIGFRCGDVPPVDVETRCAQRSGNG